MIRHGFVFIFMIGLSVLVCQGQGSAYFSSKQASLLPLLEVLDKAGVSGSLEFSGSCDSFNGPEFPEFPEFRAPATSVGPALQIVREMFAQNPSMRVTQDADGTIRMIQHSVPTDILNLKISHISFETGRPPAQHPIYSANAALAHVFETPEVKGFMKDRDIKGPWFGLYMGAPPPSVPPPNTPYISGTRLDDVTFSQALDHILKAFPGIWFYEDCPRTDKRNRVVSVGFYHLQKTGMGSAVQ